DSHGSKDNKFHIHSNGFEFQNLLKVQELDVFVELRSTFFSYTWLRQFDHRRKTIALHICTYINSIWEQLCTTSLGRHFYIIGYETMESDQQLATLYVSLHEKCKIMEHCAINFIDEGEISLGLSNSFYPCTINKMNIKQINGVCQYSNDGLSIEQYIRGSWNT
ncbi:hypothetical protein CR513_38203, partial [Mucuna pruriens]